MFTPDEILLIKEQRRLSFIARKRGVSHTYVRMVLSGDKPVKNGKSKQIYKDLKQVLEIGIAFNSKMQAA